MTKGPKGRRAVSAALVLAAADLLAEVGPRFSLRDVGQRAGANHGQVHHYFGSKRALLRAAMRHLAQEHYTNATERAGGGPFPPPATVGEDRRYWQAVMRVVLDGDLETARTEVDEGISVPRRALEAMSKGTPSTELKAQLAASATLQLGWAALEEFVLILVGAEDDERDAIREHIRETSVTLVGGSVEAGRSAVRT